jgi:glycosyltransferase involved in cell wall biosynthesis
MKLSIHTRYDQLGASSRYRYFMYLDQLYMAGWQVKLYPLLGDDYLHQLYSTGKKSSFKLFIAIFRRIITVIKSSDKLIIEYELLPFLPYWLEALLLRHKKYILNLDDNVWEKYANKAWLKNKFDRLAKHASGIVIANDFLLRKVGSLNNNILKVPTVVDLDLYKVSKPKFSKFTVVWIGTPVTYCYLQAFAKVLQTMAGNVDFELLVIASKSLKNKKISGVQMRFVDWSQETEVDLLTRSHVGIMPLTDDELSKGKSAFKLIQYLAAGLPVIASPIGENCNIVNDGINGFLVNSQSEWTEALTTLCNDHICYNKMATTAKKSSKQYSIQKYSPILLEFLAKIFN